MEKPYLNAMAGKLTNEEEELMSGTSYHGQLPDYISGSGSPPREHGFRPTFLPEEQPINMVQPSLKMNDKPRTEPVVVNFALSKSQNLKSTLFECESQDSASSDPETKHSKVPHSFKTSTSLVEHHGLQEETPNSQSDSDQFSYQTLDLSHSESQSIDGLINPVSEVGCQHSFKETSSKVNPKRRSRKAKGLVRKKGVKCSKDNALSLGSSNQGPSQGLKLDLNEEQLSASVGKSKSPGTRRNPVLSSLLHAKAEASEVVCADLPVDLCSKTKDVHVELTEGREGTVSTRHERPSKMADVDSGHTNTENGNLPMTEENSLAKSTSGDSKADLGQRKKKKRKLLSGKPGEGSAVYKNVITRGLVMEGGGLGIQAAPEIKPKQKRYRGKQTVFCCSLCPKTFPLNCRLTKHLKTHAGIKPFMCTECGNCFTQNSSLQKHMRTHTGEKPYECPECHRTFSESGTLVRHRRTHSGYKPHPCPHCSKRFAQKNSLKIHIRSHTGERPHKCPRCPKSFARLRYLSTHIRIHTGDKPFKCPVCFKPFAAQSNLKSHMITHSGEKPHVCRVCNKCFSHKKTLQHHTRTHFEEDPFACRVCGKVFAYASSLHKHMKSHGPSNQFFCNVCERSFCDNFSLKGHMRTHSGEAPFTCSVCGKGLYYRSSLKKHLQRHNDTPEEKLENVSESLS
ncbi:zinc finger protein 34-like [Liolophura sinensis]|uniref:zinc finger protein 34-like n=1 Tax=Liolophura sinensis TaxID=3198878 RepID=UPI003158CCC6